MEDELSFIDACRKHQLDRYLRVDEPKVSNWHCFYPKAGDLVKLRTGTAPQRVIAVNRASNSIMCEYISSGKQLGFRPISDFEPYTELTEVKDEMKDKLFKTLTDNRFGTGLAIDSDGKYVLKMQDNGNFEAFEAIALKKVMPYTFDVAFIGNSSNRGSSYSYRGREGQVKVGDILLLEDNFSLARVVATNTESENATKTFKGFKLVTEVLE